MSPIRDNAFVRVAIFHPRVRDVVRSWPVTVRRDVGEAIFALQQGVNLGAPRAKPMRTVAAGVEELRIKDEDGQYRVFYLAKFATGVLVFHAFIKKTRTTPQHEIELARKRLKDLI
jgi:phage-related protein